MDAESLDEIQPIGKTRPILDEWLRLGLEMVVKELQI